MSLENPFAERYEQLCHAMQTGVRFDQENGSDDGTPKHLRVGINCRAVEHGALIRLLIAKGVITENEFCHALNYEMEREVERYESLLERKYGIKVTLM